MSFIGVAVRWRAVLCAFVKRSSFSNYNKTVQTKLKAHTQSSLIKPFVRLRLKKPHSAAADTWKSHSDCILINVISSKVMTMNTEYLSITPSLSLAPSLYVFFFVSVCFLCSVVLSVHTNMQVFLYVANVSFLSFSISMLSSILQHF